MQQPMSEERKARVDAIRAIIGRLERGGRYARILIDRVHEVFVFVKHDGSRQAIAPEALLLLFTVKPRARA